MQVVVPIPEGLEKLLAESPGGVEARVRLDLAVLYYRQGVISLAKAVELAGVPREEFAEAAGERGRARNYQVSDDDRDLQWARLHS